MVDVLGFVGMGVCGIALLFAIVSVALNNWADGSNGNVDVTIGLWKYCVQGTCETIPDSSMVSNALDAYRAVRAMLILAILLLAGAVVCVIVRMFVMKDKHILTLIGGALAAVAGLFLLIGMAVYAGELYEPYYKSTHDLSAGFALDIVAWILAWIGAGILIASKFMAK